MDKIWYDVTYLWDNPKYRYEVTIDGDARHVNRKTGEIRYVKVKPGQYTRIGNIGLHRVMATHFQREILPGEVVRHLNDIKHDNRLCNLEIGTQGDNERDKYRNNPELSKKIGAAVSASMKGKKQSLEHNAAISAGLKGKKRDLFSPEHRAAVSAAQKGKPKSPEHCAAMSAARKGKKRGPYKKKSSPEQG